MRASALLFVGIVLWLHPVHGGTQSRFSSTADTVAVYATVVDNNGRLVPGLTAEDFEVYDDGKPQKISQFEAGSVPITIAVMLDDSPSLQEVRGTIAAAGEALIRALKPGDRATVGLFSRTVRIEGHLTGDHDELLARLQTSLPPMAGTALWDALSAGLSVVEDEPGRRVVLLMTDGDDNSSDVDPSIVTERVLRGGVMLYAVGIQSKEGRLNKGVASLAAVTGGWSLELKGAQNLPETFKRVADELRSHYLLGFNPTSADGRRHRLDVKVRGRGLSVRTRQNYFAPVAKAPANVR